MQYSAEQIFYILKTADDYGPMAACNKYGISITTYREIYNKHKLTFVNKKEMKIRTDDEKREIMEKIAASDLGFGAACTRYGVTPQTIYNWRNYLKSKSEKPAAVKAISETNPEKFKLNKPTKTTLTHINEIQKRGPEIINKIESLKTYTINEVESLLSLQVIKCAEHLKNVFGENIITSFLCLEIHKTKLIDLK
jgi:transposase-like protein